jgi:hypothetical protein
MHNVRVRPLAPAEIHHIVDYLVGSSPADRERMGLANVPPREALAQAYLEACTTPEQDAKSFYLVWLVDDRPIGFSSLKGIVRGEHAGMHLHIWDASLRGKGHGALLFCLSALEFHRRFQLKSLVCEPRSTNPMPNRMLAKIGFPLLRTYVGASSELSAVAELNRYDVAADVAEAYLLSHGLDRHGAPAVTAAAAALGAQPTK